jgi:signal transduction histidine kinase
MVGRHVSHLIPPDRAHEWQVLHARIQRGETVEPFETIRRHKDGHHVAVSVTLSPVSDADGRVTNISAIMRDISERKRLEAEILEASEREQRRIANDLHDGLGQQLAGISCLSNALRTDLAGNNASQAPQAVKISRLLNGAVALTRSLSRGLHPVVNEPNGLMSALHELAANTTKSFAVSCVFTCPQLVLFEDNAVATHLFRIAQEAVSNAIEHAGPQHIMIELIAGPAHTVLTVNDDGTGFHQSLGRPSGMGMRIMSYRAGVIGGQFSVQKKAGTGTEVVCTIPHLVRQPS